MNAPPRPIRVSFTALHAYPLFDPDVDAAVGGMETRAWMLARQLAESDDFDVHFLVQAPRRFRRRECGKITVWNLGDGFDHIRRDVSQHVNVLDRFPWVAVRRWSARLIWELPLLALLRPFRTRRDPLTPDPLYAEVAPDVVCCFGVSATAATGIASAHAGGHPALLFLASNSDLDARYRPDSDYVNPNGEHAAPCAYAIHEADTIIAQTTTQQQLLKERFGRDSLLMPNIVDLGMWADGRRHAPLAASIPSRYVLWVGRADDFHKRPRLLLDLAERLPEIPFVMILSPANPTIEREIRSAQPGNVTILPPQPFDRMPPLLARAALYVSTSSTEFEGSPNLFLQAAASSVPVASLEATTALIDSGGGCCCEGDLGRLATLIGEWWSDPEQSRRIGRAGRDYVAEVHDSRQIVAQLTELLHACSG